jgi:hypothetical protein
VPQTHLIEAKSAPSAGPTPGQQLALEAAAAFAHDSGLIVHVVTPRTQGIVREARATADQESVSMVTDIAAATVRVRFGH